MLAEPPSLTIEAGFHHHTAEVSIRGTLSTATAPLLAEMLDMVLDRQPRDLVLDMAGVIACDRAAASVITRTALTLPPLARLVIRHPGPAVRRLLTPAGLDAGAGPGSRPDPGPAADQDELATTGLTEAGHRPTMAP